LCCFLFDLDKFSETVMLFSGRSRWKSDAPVLAWSAEWTGASLLFGLEEPNTAGTDVDAVPLYEKPLHPAISVPAPG
jgi:hypothetical protein